MLPGLLRLLGFSRQEVRDRKSGRDGASLFYTRPHRENEWALREIYALARDKYRARVKQLHPDRRREPRGMRQTQPDMGAGEIPPQTARTRNMSPIKSSTLGAIIERGLERRRKRGRIRAGKRRSSGQIVSAPDKSCPAPHYPRPD